MTMINTGLKGFRITYLIHTVHVSIHWRLSIENLDRKKVDIMLLYLYQHCANYHRSRTYSSISVPNPEQVLTGGRGRERGGGGGEPEFSKHKIEKC